MDRLKEIETRKNEIRSLLETINDEKEIEKLNEEVDSLNEEEKKLKEIQERTNKAKDLENKCLEAKELKIDKEERKMEKKYDLSSKEYRTAWAKAMMGKELDEIDKRAIGDAIGTTATTFVASTANTQGVNNLGLLIPESLRTDLLKLAELASPFYRDITKLSVDGNVDLPYLFSADDAEWYAETTTTKNEGQEYKSIKLTGHELSKSIEITFKAESMTVDSFYEFLLKELNKKMNKALIKAVLYGTGSSQPTGVTNGLTAKESDSPIELMKLVLSALDNEERVGAKMYIASDIADMITFYKDSNGNYPYLVAGLKGAGNVPVETDPFLKSGDIIAGNAENYILNFNTELNVMKEVKTQPRRVVYEGYLVADGNAKSGAFAYGKYKAATPSTNKASSTKKIVVTPTDNKSDNETNE